MMDNILDTYTFDAEYMELSFKESIELPDQTVVPRIKKIICLFRTEYVEQLHQFKIFLHNSSHNLELMNPS